MKVYLLETISNDIDSVDINPIGIYSSHESAEFVRTALELPPIDISGHEYSMISEFEVDQHLSHLKAGLRPFYVERLTFGAWSLKDGARMVPGLPSEEIITWRVCVWAKDEADAHARAAKLLDEHKQAMDCGQTLGEGGS